MDEVERLARAMAVADGYDPDEVIPCSESDFVLRMADRKGYALSYKRPAWMLHQRRANLFLVAMKEYNRKAD